MEKRLKNALERKGLMFSENSNVYENIEIIDLKKALDGTRHE